MQAGSGSLRSVLSGALALALIVVVGCGGSGSGSTTTGTSTATSEQVSVALTDAGSADITAFVADVTSIQLVKANGVRISVLPNTTTVNFAELTQLSELVSAGSVPSGAYVSVMMDLNFAGAGDQVALVNGATTTNGSLLLKDAQGNALSTLTVTVNLGNGRPLVVAPGLPSHLLLDFDLSQSCAIDETVTPNTLTVRPVLSGDAQLQRPVLTRVRGLLKGVDAASGSIKLDVRPFTPATSGDIVLATDSTTVFVGPDTDGNGQTNLADLARAPAGAPVTARGQFNAQVGRFLCTQVEYGETVAGGTHDAADGSVSRIQGTTYTLVGCTVARRGGGVTFNTTLTATLDSTTIVRRPGSEGSAGIAAIGIGQHVVLGGTLSGTVPNLALDCTSAAQGGAALLETHIIGLLKAVGTGALTLDAKIIERRPVEDFDFAGAGLDPKQYSVATGTLNLSGIAANQVIVCAGLVTPGATSAFSARLVASLPVDVLIARWAPPGTATPFAGTTTGFPLTLNNAGLVQGGFLVTNPGRDTPLTASPSLVLGSSHGPFVIGQNGTVTVFDGDGAAAWVSEINARVANGAHVLGMSAAGSFDGGNPGTFTVNGMSAELR